MNASPVRVRGSITQASLRLMQNLMDKWSKHPFFVQFSREVASLAKARTPQEEDYAVWAWIRKNVEYRSDPVGTQWVQDPFETAIKSKAGNCANMATLAGTMLQALGHPVEATAVWWNDRSEFTHAVARDFKTGLIVDPVSPTFDWPPFSKGVHALMGSI